MHDLIRVLADFLHSRPTAAFAGADWSGLYALSRAHEVTGIVFQQCREFLPEPGPFQRRWELEKATWMKRSALMASVSAALREKGIPFFCVKGLDLAALYPVPALRTMGDCDVVVHERDKERAHRVFLDLGFQCEGKQQNEWVYVKQGLAFELHHRLLYDAVGNLPAAQAFCDTAWEHVRDGAPDRAFHYIFLLLHLHKHLIHSGVGLRHFMDVYLVSKLLSEDRGWIHARLTELGMAAFERRVQALCRYWFDGGEAFDGAEEMTEKVLLGGVFGFQDPANGTHRGADVMLVSASPRPLTRLRYLAASAFPGYDNMHHVPYYSALDGRPWLLPAFWLYRVYRAAKHKKSGMRMVKDALVSPAGIERRRRELALWGL